MIHFPTWKSTIREWLRRPGTPAVALAFVAIVCSIALRAQHLDFPPFHQLDEHHFLNAALALLNGKPDSNDHPPLGKLLIALFLSGGNDPLRWRLSSFVFGLGSIVFVFALASRLFRDRRAGMFAAMFVAVDGCFIAYSRIALVDGVLVSLMLASAALCISERWWSWLAAGFVAGLATSVKLSAVVLVVPLLFVMAQRSRSWKAFVGAACGSIVLAVLAYWIVGTIAGTMGHVPEPWNYPWRDTRADLLKHLGATARRHPMTSSWYTWFEPRVVVNFVFVLTTDGRIRMLSMLGNLVLWWATPLCVLAGVGVASAAARRAAMSATGVVGRVAVAIRCAEAKCWVPLAVFWFVPLLPWMVSDRDSYLYHYMPAYAFGLVAAAGWVAEVERRRPTTMLLVLCAVVLVSAFYAPLWAHLPMGYSGLDARLFLWR